MVLKFSVIKRFFAVCFIFFAGCTGKDNHLSIEFSKDSTSIYVSNIDDIGFNLLKNSHAKGQTLDNLISVLEIPGDDDSLGMEREFPGKVRIEGKQLIFEPDAPFVKGKQYLVASFVQLKLGGAGKAIRNQLNTRGKAIEKTLAR